MKKGLFGNRNKATKSANPGKPIQATIRTNQTGPPTPERREANNQKRQMSSRVKRLEYNDDQEERPGRRQIRLELQNADEK